MSADFLHGQAQALTKRGLSEDTCAKFGYTVGEHHGKPVQIANYMRDGEVVAQKVRYAGKEFNVRGSLKGAGLYGQHLWSPGRRIVITEGEIDCLSVSQAQENKWPVVSVPNGAQGAKKTIAQELEWLEKFEEVVLVFDMDEPGQAAAQECALLFTPGKCKIAHLSMKDPNELLLAGKAREIITAIWNAKVFRPDGIVTFGDIKEKALAKIILFTQEIVHTAVTLNEKVGLFYLEQPPVETGKRVAGKLAGRRFHVPDNSWTQEELNEAFEKVEASGNVFMYDSFGSTEWPIVLAKMKYLAAAEGVKHFFLDHLTALAAAEEDERKALEKITAEIASFAQAYNVCMYVISHLATPEGKPHEEGGRVMIRHFKGSRAIGFWAHFMFGLERDQQAEEIAVRQHTTFRILKDRFTGQATGKTIGLGYDVESGRLFEQVLEETPMFPPEPGEGSQDF